MPVVVMTGGTSGFGAIAAERLVSSGDIRLVLGARRPASAGESIPLDLSALDSVRAFATAVRERLGDAPIDALVLNAGMILPDVTGRTVDGFETTFAVNHLALSPGAPAAARARGGSDRGHDHQRYARPRGQRRVDAAASRQRAVTGVPRSRPRP